MAGRLSHQTFRGLLSVHSRYGLSARGTASRSFPSKASTISLPPSSLRLLPAGAKVAGWELHPLKRDTFARRTLTPFFPIFRRPSCCRRKGEASFFLERL